MIKKYLLTSLLSICLAACTQNNEKDMVLFKNSCDGKNNDGCLNYGLLKKEAGDTKVATEIFKKACDDSHYKSCYELSKLYDVTSKEHDRLLQQACDGNIEDACKAPGIFKTEHNQNRTVASSQKTLSKTEKKNNRKICSCRKVLAWFEEGKAREEAITARSGIVNKTAMYNVTNNILIVEEYLQKNFQDKGIDTNISCPGKKTDDDVSDCLVPANNFRAGLNENGEQL